MPPTPKRFSHVRRWTVADARAVLTAMASSGLSLDAFAKREGLQAQRLRRWRQQVDVAPVEQAAAAAFVEITRGAPAQRVEIQLRSGRMLVVSESIDATALRRIVDVLEHDAPC